MNKNSKIETKFREEAEKKGYKIYWKGYPDYIIIKDKEIIFVECKRPLFKRLNGNIRGQHLKRHQKEIKDIFESLGLNFKVYRGNWEETFPCQRKL